MPQPRKHGSHAERQAAYRRRQRQALASRLEDKALPPLPAVSNVEAPTTATLAEMEFYYDERSERWKDSDRANAFEQKMDDLREIIDLAAEWVA